MSDIVFPAPYDDPAIEAADQLIRRINPKHHVVYDENIKRNKISSKAFTPSSGENGGMSVDVPKLIEAAGLSVSEYVTTPTYTASVIFTVAPIRAVGLRVGCTPIEDNPYHADVWGSQDRPSRFSNAQKNAIREASSWLVEIPDVDL